MKRKDGGATWVNNYARLTFRTERFGGMIREGSNDQEVFLLGCTFLSEKPCAKVAT